MPSKTWQDFFFSHPNKEAGNQDTKVFSTTWALTTNHATKLATLTNDNNLTILAIDGNNKIIVLHSFKNFKGILLHPTKKYRCLLGSGRVALAIIVNEISLPVHLDLTTPTYVNIIGCLD
jgi:hypothetical protein